MAHPGSARPPFATSSAGAPTSSIFDRDAERGKAIESELGGTVVFVDGSVLDDDDTQAAVAAATDLGGLRGVVACAGGAPASGRTIGRDGTPHDRQVFTDTVDLNLVGTFNTLRFAASAMSDLEPVDDDGQRGAIVDGGLHRRLRGPDRPARLRRGQGRHHRHDRRSPPAISRRRASG